MNEHQPEDPAFAHRVRESFARQRLMALLGAELLRIEPGHVEIALAFRPDLTQQHGFLHGGVVTTIVDTACGYAALTLIPAGAEVLTVEFKVNLLRPAVGDRFIARGQVVKPGKTITVVQGDVVSESAGKTALVATMMATMIRQNA